MTKYVPKIVDAKAWNAKIKGILGDKLVSVTCVGSQIISFETTEDLTSSEKEAVEALLGVEIEKEKPI